MSRLRWDAKQSDLVPTAWHIQVNPTADDYNQLHLGVASLSASTRNCDWIVIREQQVQSNDSYLFQEIVPMTDSSQHRKNSISFSFSFGQENALLTRAKLDIWAPIIVLPSVSWVQWISWDSPRTSESSLKTNDRMQEEAWQLNNKKRRNISTFWKQGLTAFTIRYENCWEAWMEDIWAWDLGCRIFLPNWWGCLASSHPDLLTILEGCRCLFHSQAPNSKLETIWHLCWIPLSHWECPWGPDRRLRPQPAYRQVKHSMMLEKSTIHETRWA